MIDGDNPTLKVKFCKSVLLRVMNGRLVVIKAWLFLQGTYFLSRTFFHVPLFDSRLFDKSVEKIYYFLAPNWFLFRKKRG